MARHTRSVDFDEEDAGSPILARSLMWGGLAVVALGGVALSGQSETGAQRIAALVNRTPPASARPVVATRPAESDSEAKRLAESVKLLAADRDRLLARLDALERNMEVTGSTGQDHSGAAATPPPPPMTALPPGWTMTPSTIPPAAGLGPQTLPAPGTAGTAVTVSRSPPSAQPNPSAERTPLSANNQAAESTVTK